jgi:hypothetical protein
LSDEKRFIGDVSIDLNNTMAENEVGLLLKPQNRE